MRRLEFGRQTRPDFNLAPRFIYAVDGRDPPRDPPAVGLPYALGAKWPQAFCAGCGRTIEGSQRIFCFICGMYAGTGRVVMPCGGTWVEDGSDYASGRDSTAAVSDFVRHDPYRIGAGTTDRKPEKVIFSRFGRRRVWRDYDPKKPQEQWRASIGHRWYIDFLARSQVGRAQLSPWQLERFQARISSKPTRKRQRPEPRPHDRRPTAASHELRLEL